MILSEPAPPLTASYIRPDGLFQLGGGNSALRPVTAEYSYYALPTQLRWGGVGAKQFVEEFQPVVYYNPYSGPSDSHPDQFISNYNIASDSVDGYV